MGSQKHPRAHFESRRDYAGKNEVAAGSAATSRKHVAHSSADPELARGESEISSGDWVHGEEDFFKDFFVARALRLNFNFWFFPGLIAHELGHVIGCWLAGSKVAKVVLWSQKGGYVVHQRVRGSASVIISLGPFFFNNFLALFFLFESLKAFSSVDGALYGLFSLWLGFSFAIYSFPSLHDLRMSVDGLKRSKEKWGAKKDAVSRLLSLIALPVIYFAYLFFVTAMAIFAAGPGSRVLWFLFVFALVYSGAFSEGLQKLM